MADAIPVSTPEVKPVAHKKAPKAHDAPAPEGHKLPNHDAVRVDH